MPEAVGTDPIVKEIRLEARPETVFAFFTEPEKLTRWLAAEASLDPRPGGINHQAHLGGEGDPSGPHCMRGEFVEVTPPSRVVFTWGFESASIGIPPGSSTVEVTLEPDGAGTLLRLVNHDVPAVARAGHDAGWTTMLERLAAAVA